MNIANRLVHVVVGILILTLSAPTNGITNLKARQANYDSQSAQTQYNLQTIDYGNCSHLYAVQPGDTLNDVARVSATTEEFVINRNDIQDENDIYPGLVLCLETARNGVGIPVTGGPRSGVEVSSVSTDQTVTVRGVNFPAGERMNVYMFQLGVGNPNVNNLGIIVIPANGTFEQSFQIPAELRSFRNLIIRFRNPDENVSASATFINANVARITPNECAEYYTVRSGDILSIIAQEVNVAVERLVAINNLVDANVVFPGQMLCIEVE